MSDTLCPACEEGHCHVETNTYTRYGKVYHNQESYVCDTCGCSTVDGSMHDRNVKQLVTEMVGPYKPIEIGCIHNARAYFDWSWQGVGFGQLSFSYDRSSGRLSCNNECMSRESVRTLLRALADHIADNAILSDE